MAPLSSKRGASATLTAADDLAASPPHAAFLHLVLECRRPLAGGARWRLDDVDEVRIGRGPERLASRDASGLAVEIPDERVSTRHARLARLAGGWALEDLGSKNGSRVGGAPVKRVTVRDGDVIEIGATLFLLREATTDGADDPATIATAPGLATLSLEVAAEHRRLAAVARSDVPVLLLGETGTGKELAARALHALSQRKGRFVAVNCGALAASLLEAELFGHRQGAFSGATESRPGLVRSADRGTLFLDEIGDLPLPSQAALLRVLQEKEVTAVGETTPTRVDVRVVAATHRDLRGLCEERRFRADLLARLEGYTSRLAPLRDRREDLGLLVATLLERLAPARAARLALHPHAGRALLAHDWPGNVRELEQALAAAVALAADDVITLGHLPERIRQAPRAAAPPSPPSSTRSPAPSLSPEDEALRAQLTALLEEHRGSINGVARAMNKDRTQIRRWLARFAIDADRFR